MTGKNNISLGFLYDIHMRVNKRAVPGGDSPYAGLRFQVISWDL